MEIERRHDSKRLYFNADVVGNIALVAYRYEMIYARSGKRNHATGRDMWVFEQHSGAWIAVWRTMLDMQESVA